MKVLAVSSIGGHWIQLLRLLPAFEGAEVEFASTKGSFAEMVPGFKFHYIPDGNRWNKIGLVKGFLKTYSIISKVKPDVIITTGAAPGLLALLLGKFRGIKTIWVDSIANCETLSMSGKIALKFADVVYTQWEHLQQDQVKFKGNVLK